MKKVIKFQNYQKVQFKVKNATKCQQCLFYSDCIATTFFADYCLFKANNQTPTHQKFMLVLSQKGIFYLMKNFFMYPLPPVMINQYCNRYICCYFDRQKKSRQSFFYYRKLKVKKAFGLYLNIILLWTSVFATSIKGLRSKRYWEVPFLYRIVCS